MARNSRKMVQPDPADLEDRIQHEKERLEAQRIRKLVTLTVRDRLFLDYLQQVLDKVLAKPFPVPKEVLRQSQASKAPTHILLNALLSDLHLGANLDKRELPHPFTAVEEARRLASIALQVANWNLRDREVTELFAFLAGDIIQGQLHDLRDGQPLAEQVAAAVYLLIQVIVFWASHFKKVTIYCTPGNHGRNKSRHPERATSQKWDAIETMIYVAVKAGVKHLPNVTVEIPYRPYIEYQAFGVWGFITHGDTVLKPGYPSKSINIAAIRSQANEWNALRGIRRRYRLFGCGHVHAGATAELPTGETFISNGPLIPSDGFGIASGMPHVKCGQQGWESRPGEIVYCHRYLRVDRSTDRDKSLDKVVQRFRSL